MKLKDILSEREKLQIAELRLLMLRTNRLSQARQYRNKIIRIMLNARKRYLSETEAQ